MVKGKVVITGGAGFIGSHLTEEMLRRGYQVIVIDNLSTGRKENLGHLKGDENLKVVITDINDTAGIKQYFTGVDYVFHLAALADIVPSIVNPVSYHRANVDGTLSVLEAVREMAPNLRKFIYTASSSCYGAPGKFPTSEEAKIQPEYPYALTKYLGEQIALNWGKIYKLPVISLRLFNVYGPRSRTSGTYGAVFGVFLAQKLANQPFTVVGDGNQTRDFTFVTDVVEAYINAATSDVKGEVFNVGSGGTYSISSLVKLLGGKVTFIPKRPGEPDCTFADTTKIRKLLGWKPRISFGEGVKRILDNIEYWKDAPVWTPETIAQATEGWFKYLLKE
jgi:UDP-glucose 4-epimerase